jgi:hypothetical protein
MNYCIVNSDDIIENIIVSDAAFAKKIGAVDFYKGAKIGDKYNPPIPISQMDRLEAQTTYTAMMTDTLIGG